MSENLTFSNKIHTVCHLPQYTGTIIPRICLSISTCVIVTRVITVTREVLWEVFTLAHVIMNQGNGKTGAKISASHASHYLHKHCLLFTSSSLFFSYRRPYLQQQQQRQQTVSPSFPLSLCLSGCHPTYPQQHRSSPRCLFTLKGPR